MGFEVALGTSDATARSSRVRCDAARSAAGAPLYFVVTPVSPPRLWSSVADAVCGAMEASIEGRGADERAVVGALDAAAAAVAGIRSQLVEPNLAIDARVGALVAQADVIRVALTAGVRLYRARGGAPESLFNDPNAPNGVAAARAVIHTERVQSGDLLVLGTSEVFAARAIGGLASMLTRKGRPAVSEICEAILGSCRDAGVGAAAIVLRMT